MWNEYSRVKVTPKDEWDVYLELDQTNLWDKTQGFFSGKPVEATARRFYGSGHTWYEFVTNNWGETKEERVSDWMSGTLHDLWWDWYKEVPTRESAGK
jgi:hypothetical protein